MMSSIFQLACLVWAPVVALEAMDPADFYHSDSSTDLSDEEDVRRSQEWSSYYSFGAFIPEEVIPCYLADFPLGRAVAFNDIEKVKTLLDAGADVNIQNVLGSTLLHSTNNTLIIQLLLRKGANPTLQDSCKVLPVQMQKNPRSQELLRRAALLWGVVDQNIGDDPLLLAISTGDQERIKSIVVQECSMDKVSLFLNEPDALGATCYMYATALGKKEIVQWLLTQGALPWGTACGKTVFTCIEHIIADKKLLDDRVAAYIKILNLSKQWIGKILYLLCLRCVSSDGFFLPAEMVAMIMHFLIGDNTSRSGCS